MEGEISDVQLPKTGEYDVQFIGVRNGGRIKKIKSSEIVKLLVDDKPMHLQMHFPTGRTVLIDDTLANAIADQRLLGLERTRSQLVENIAFETASQSAVEFARSSVRRINAAAGVTVADGAKVILITDYPPPQRDQLLKMLDGAFPKLNSIFGFGEQDLVLPSKLIIAAFRIRKNLATFQSEIVGNKNYGTIRAFFQIVEEHPIVSVEDDRSAQYMLWQAAWGLSQAYSQYAYSDVQMPSWVRVGLNQHCGDVLVPGITDHPSELREIQTELKLGSLNGIMQAVNLPGNRQLVCKLLIAHLYRLSPGSFGQFLHYLKLGMNTEQTLALTYDMKDTRIAQSFGESISLPLLIP